jgi:repressor LexA
MTTTTTRPAITDRQRAVYDWICQRHAETGVGVGVREIGQALRYSSPGGAYCHLKYLEKRGYITRISGRAYSIVPASEANA